MTENKDWQSFFAALRGSFKLPSCHDLSNRLLDQCYSETKTKVLEKIANASSVGIQSDTWRNIRNEGIFNVIVNTPEPVFYKSVPTGDSSQTGEFYAEKMKEVVQKIGPDKVFGPCTDNDTNCQSSWRIVEEFFSYKFLQCYGCVDHTLDLLMHDILTLTSIAETLEQVKYIAKKIKKAHILLSKFNLIQEKLVTEKTQEKAVSLKIPAKTRWNSVNNCRESFDANKPTLRQLAISDAAHILNSDSKNREKSTEPQKRVNN